MADKKLSTDKAYYGRLDVRLRDQGIVYANSDDGKLSVALFVRRFPELAGAEKDAHVMFRVDNIGAVCLVTLTDVD